MNITLRQLRYFVALCETGNFGRAAESMHVSQPALSVQIRELEGQTGTQLVERQPRAIVLTSAGHDMLRHARKVLAEVGDLEHSARWQRGLGGRLNFGVIPTVAPYLLPVALPMLRDAHPGLELGVREARTERLLDDLAEGRLDAVVLAVPTGEEGLIATPVFEDRFVLATAKGQQAQVAGREETLRPAQLDPDRLLLLEEGHCLSDQALEVCALTRTQTRLDLGASSLGTLCGLVSEGFGVTLLPEISLPTELNAARGLSALRFTGNEPRRTIGVVRRASSRDDGWFSDLADLIGQAGARLLADARAILPAEAA